MQTSFSPLTVIILQFLLFLYILPCKNGHHSHEILFCIHHFHYSGNSIFLMVFSLFLKGFSTYIWCWFLLFTAENSNVKLLKEVYFLPSQNVPSKLRLLCWGGCLVVVGFLLIRGFPPEIGCLSFLWIRHFREELFNFYWYHFYFWYIQWFLIIQLYIDMYMYVYIYIFDFVMLFLGCSKI